MARSLRFERISIPLSLLAFSRRIRFSRNKFLRQLRPRGSRRWQREGGCRPEIDYSQGNAKRTSHVGCRIYLSSRSRCLSGGDADLLLFLIPNLPSLHSLFESITRS